MGQAGSCCLEEKELRALQSPPEGPHLSHPSLDHCIMIAKAEH